MGHVVSAVEHAVSDFAEDVVQVVRHPFDPKRWIEVIADPITSVVGIPALGITNVPYSIGVAVAGEIARNHGFGHDQPGPPSYEKPYHPGLPHMPDVPPPRPPKRPKPPPKPPAPRPPKRPNPTPVPPLVPSVPKPVLPKKPKRKPGYLTPFDVYTGRSSYSKKRRAPRTRSRGVKRMRIPASHAYSRSVKRPGVGSRRNTLVVTNREYVDKVVTQTSGFDVAINEVVNPGNVAMFPWLSKIANNFETYKFNRLSFEYEPHCSSATRGGIAMYMDHDVSDPVANSWQEATSNASCIHGSAFVKHVHSARAQDLRTKGQYRHVQLSTATGDRHEDVGRFLLCNDIAQAGDETWGKVYVSYSVELYTPQAGDLTGGSGSISHIGGTTKPVIAFTSTSGTFPLKSNCATTAGEFEFTRPYRGTMLLSCVDGVGGAISAGPVVSAESGCTINSGTSVFQATKGMTSTTVTAKSGATFVVTSAGATATATSYLSMYDGTD